MSVIEDKVSRNLLLRFPEDEEEVAVVVLLEAM